MGFFKRFFGGQEIPEITDPVFGKLRSDSDENRLITYMDLNPGGGKCEVLIEVGDEVEQSLESARTAFNQLQTDGEQVKVAILELLSKNPMTEHVGADIDLPGLCQNPVKVELGTPDDPIQLDSLFIDTKNYGQSPKIYLSYIGLAPNHWCHFTIQDLKIRKFEVDG